MISNKKVMNTRTFAIDGEKNAHKIQIERTRKIFKTFIYTAFIFK